MSIRCFTWLAVVLSLTGCAAGSASVATPALTGVQWRLTEVGPHSKPITLMFHADGRIAGYGGCNRYFGRYQTGSGSMLRITDLAGTKMLCLGSQMKREQAYLRALRQVTHYRLVSSHLQLRYSGGQLDFTPAP